MESKCAMVLFVHESLNIYSAQWYLRIFTIDKISIESFLKF